MSRSGANIVLRHRTPLPPSLPRRLFSSSAPALVSDQQSFHLPSGRLKVSLSAPYLIGRAQSRGERPYQEDNFLVKSVTIAREEVERSLQEGLSGEQRKGGAWKGKAKDVGKIEDPTEQVLLAAVFDGHNGKEASGYLTEHLAEIVETCKADQVPDAIRKYRDLGGYFRRFRGGYLENLGNEVWQRSEASSDSKSDSDAASSSTHKSPARPLELGERMTLAFLLADQHLISAHPDVGAVATVVLLTPLPPAPPSPPTLYPFHSSPALLLTVAHLGDTRALLCASRSGRVEKLTEEHHPDSRVEADRLRRIGTGVVTDSFGESRWGGALANTRGLGDAKFKKLGVTGEPQIAKRILKGTLTASPPATLYGVDAVAACRRGLGFPGASLGRCIRGHVRPRDRRSLPRKA